MKASEANADGANQRAAEQPAAGLTAGAAPRSTVRVSRWEVSAGGAGWLATSSVLRPGFHADAAIFLSGPWRLAAQFALTTAETTPIQDDSGNRRGELTTQPLLALLSADYCLDQFSSGRLRACGGLAGGAHLESGSTSGEFIFHSSNRWLARPTFGLDLHLAWLPIRFFAVSLGFTGLVLPFRATFEIESLATRSLPLFEGLIRLSLVFGANR